MDKQTDWHPMETAPKDRCILVYSPKYDEQFVVFHATCPEDESSACGIHWIGPLTNLIGTKCPHCGGANCQTTGEDEPAYQDMLEQQSANEGPAK